LATNGFEVTIDALHVGEPIEVVPLMSGIEFFHPKEVMTADPDELSSNPLADRAVEPRMRP
jgi:hypothetical protein